jgi:thiamine biosynthesis lipoprotein
MLSGCGTTLHEESAFVLGTRLTLRVEAIAGRDVRRDLGELIGEARRLERRYDPGRAASVVSAFNAGGRIRFSGEAGAALRRGYLLARATAGAFDPFLLPLTRLWGFSSPEPRTVPPAAAAIRAALAVSGYRRVRFTAAGLQLPRGGGFDGGGYLKGYAADRLRDRLRSWGYRRAIVDAGGDVALLGRRPPAWGDENGWLVMISHPRRPGSYWCSLVIRDRAVVSSGDYERAFTHNGISYHHILDPATGYPARRAVAVTVVGPDAETADALATAFFVSGHAAALRLLPRFPGYSFMMLVEEKGSLRALFSPGFRRQYSYKPY